ncbi:MAG TPA: glycogen/starch synthase [Puia sp.]|nr:glycogen/starch synthase [Puia sp.]
MEIIHVSAECYPVAKAGGLGDVVGALPKYQTDAGHVSKVVMPMYRTKFLLNNDWDVVHKGYTNLGAYWFPYTIIKERTNKLGFDLYLVDIYGLLDRERIYGYDDDSQRFTAFQIAVVDWISSWKHHPDILHVHDYHAGLIPFMVKYCYRYQHLQNIPTVLTIHNAQYQGWMGWDKSTFIPAWDPWKRGMLDWKEAINPLASGVKCAWIVTTVSNSYLDELRQSANGLEALFQFEKGKCYGILNGIDALVWDPASDKYIDNHYSVKNFREGKKRNKKILCETFDLDESKPLIVFIGRLVGEKGADILAAAIGDSYFYIGRLMNFLVLGSGFPEIESELESLKTLSQGDYNFYSGYNESLSHLMYAGADFILMPSRVEPCGLNQMYAMRYGTVPMVRNTGGLRDTVIDFGDERGYGIRFNHAIIGDVTQAVWRAVDLFGNELKLESIRSQIMQLDFSWESSVKQYLDLYKTLT